MKQLIAILVTVLLSCPPCVGAIAGTAAFNVKPAGADTNAGFFDSSVSAPGTDESQGAGTAATFTIDGSASTKATSSSAFSATTHGPGNGIIIASGSGCTTGRFEMLSQAAGVGTFDRSLGSTGSTCTGVIGGSLATLGTANSNIVAGNAVYVGAGTYTLTASLVISISSRWIGYNTTHGDLPSTSLARPLITTATNSVDGLIQLSGSSYNIELASLSLTNTASTRGTGIQAVGGHNSSNPPYFLDLVIDGFTEGINGDNAGSHFDWGNVIVQNCLIKNSTATGAGIGAIHLNGNSLNIIDSLVVDNAAHGIFGVGNAQVIRSTFARNGGTGFYASSSGMVFIHNSNFASNTASGVRVGASTIPINATLVMRNSILYNNGAFGVDAGGGGVVYYVTMQGEAGGYNAFGSNSGGNLSGYPSSRGQLALTADPFTNAASNDFSLNATAGGGAVLRGAGFPGGAPSGTGFLDVGAIQHGGGSVVPICPIGN